MKTSFEIYQNLRRSTSQKVLYYNLVFQPREITLASGRRLTYLYDSVGDLARVVTARGAKVEFWRRAQLLGGGSERGVQLPGHGEAATSSWDSRGRLVQTRPPGGDGIVLYR